MTRDEAIRIIDSLYPTDSEFEQTNQVGEELLAQAKREVNVNPLTWRNEPTRILIRYAELCEQREAESHRDFLRQHNRI